MPWTRDAKTKTRRAGIDRGYTTVESAPATVLGLIEMHILGTPLAQIDWNFLDRLATDRIPESITHDYKSKFPDPRDTEGRTRFLKSASAFANTSGGIFIFGMDETKENWLTGLPSLDEDRDVLSLHNLMRSGVEPALHHADPVTLEGPAQRKILLFAIPRSLAAPHEVNHNYGGGYWRRNSRGNYPMAVTELRRAFEESDAWRRDSQEFRDHRVNFIVSGALEGGLTGAYAGETPALFFHLLPLGRLGELLDTPLLHAFVEKEFARSPRFDGTAVVRPNVDGWIRYLADYRGRRHMQYFRNGAIEYYADLSFFKFNPEVKYLDATQFDASLVAIATKAFEWIEAVSLTGPFVLFLTLRQASGLTFRLDSGHTLVHGFDRGVIDLPPIVIDEPPKNVPLALRPLLDSVWLAAGGTHDPNFDENGNWSIPHNPPTFTPM